MFRIYLFLFTLILFSCNSDNSWKSSSRVFKQVDNILYIFPSDVSINQRNDAISYSRNALKENMKLIEELSFTDSIRFEFVHNRTEMKFASGYPYKGLAMPHLNEMYSILDLGPKSAIKHELMHILISKNWGNQYRSMQWFNEGLATYSGTMCGRTNFEEIYVYLLHNDIHIPIENLTEEFYKENEVIAYSQSAFIVKALGEKFGWQKLKEFWQGGFSSFESVFGISFTSFENELHKNLKAKHPTGVDLVWEEIKEGCP